MVNKKTTSKSGFNWYVGRNFGLELINFLSQGRSKARKEDMEAECTLPELCFGSVSHLGTRGHSRRKVSEEQDTGTRPGELGADSEGSCGGCTGRGDDSGEEISRRGELCVPKYGNYRTLKMTEDSEQSSEDVGMAGCGWEKWSCGLRLLQELRRCLKVARWRL